MSKIMKESFDNVCEDIQLKDMFMREVENATLIAFHKLNYTPKDIHKAFDKAWNNANKDDMLSDFVYSVWSVDS